MEYNITPEEEIQAYVYAKRIRKLRFDTREHHARILGVNLDFGGNIDINSMDVETRKKLY